ncbi:MAG TPA: FIST N-terminal domain-containing protein [Polyangiaceae bacterium]|jgi:hypothetical protein
MGTSAAVGKSNVRRAGPAGREAAEKAVGQLSGGKADLVLVFATAGYDQAALLDGVRDVTKATPLAGCSGEGIITQEGSDEGAHAVAVMAIASDKATFQTFRQEGYSKDARGCGAAIADRVREAGPQRAKVLLLFPDGLTGNCTDMLRALKERLPFPVVVAGGTAGDMMKLEASYQYEGGTSGRDSITGVILGGDLEAEVVVSHGCEPLGLERTVTRSDGTRVAEIDGKPAWTVFKEYLDGDPQDLSAADVVHLCIGEQLPGVARQGAGYQVIRTPLGLDKETGALFFPGGLAQGATIQMTRRDPEQIRRSAIESAEELAARRPGKKVALMFQFDCAGRGRVIFGEHATENAVAPIQGVIGRDVPWLGFHTFGEIAQLGDAPYFHNYSVVLCALYERAA